MAPIKLPGKALNIIKYIALGLGVVETVMDDKDKKWEGGASTRADPDSQRKGGAG